jgi:hypothetical protein
MPVMAQHWADHIPRPWPVPRVRNAGASVHVPSEAPVACTVSHTASIPAPVAAYPKRRTSRPMRGTSFEAASEAPKNAPAGLAAP